MGMTVMEVVLVAGSKVRLMPQTGWGRVRLV